MYAYEETVTSVIERGCWARPQTSKGGHHRCAGVCRTGCDLNLRFGFSGCSFGKSRMGATHNQLRAAANQQHALVALFATFPFRNAQFTNQIRVGEGTDGGEHIAGRRAR